MDKLLLYISNGVILFSFLLYFMMVMINRKRKITSSNAFNVTKDILNEYDSINIIENKSLFTIYNIKRKVIKIASKCYYGNSVSDIGLSLMEASISTIDNKYLNFFRKLISNLKYLYILPIATVMFNHFAIGVIDAKIGILLLTVCALGEYFLIDIKTDAISWLEKNINKVDDLEEKKVIFFVKRIILYDKLIFIGELIVILRFVAMILKLS